MFFFISLSFYQIYVIRSDFSVIVIEFKLMIKASRYDKKMFYLYWQWNIFINLETHDAHSLLNTIYGQDVIWSSEQVANISNTNTEFYM